MVAEQKPKVVLVKEADQHHAQQAVIVDGEKPPHSREALTTKSGLVRTGAIHRRCRDVKGGTLLVYAYKIGGR